MPKRVTQSEFQHIEDVLLRFPAGLSLSTLQKELDGSISRRTLSRRLAELLETGRIQRRGQGKATLYVHGAAATRGLDIQLEKRSGSPPPETAVVAEAMRPGTAGQFDTPEGLVTIDLSPASRNILAYVSRPTAARTPRGYARRVLDDYVPNRTAYIPDKLKARLHKIGKPIAAERAGGTFVRDILNRFLIDLSWASSRLEGNTYGRLDTERLIEFGQEAEGKDAKETQMILNHKAAIELLVQEDGDDIGINRFTLLNLHALLSENLMADPEASGKLRRRPVEIGGSVYTPPAIPQLIEECFTLIITKAAAIDDPFEQAFFVMVHLPYLQPFEDVNKRVSRLAANIPLIGNDLCPLSFVDVPERAYIAGTLSMYEMTRVDLLRDVFAWAYERSCQKYVVIRDSVADPELFRMKYRNALIGVISEIVRERTLPTADDIRVLAEPRVERRDLTKFVDMVGRDIARLSEGNIARYRIRLSDYRSWLRATAHAPK
jgi:Fic family protein